MKTSDPKLLAFVQVKNKEVKLKKPRELLRILQIAQENIQNILNSQTSGEEDLKLEREMLEKWDMIKFILEKDKFEGLNRKIQLRPLKFKEEIDQSGKSK